MKILVVHNRYRSGQPSGENSVVDDESFLLAENGCSVEKLIVKSDEIATWSRLRKLSLPGTIVWSRRGTHLVRDAIKRVQPDIVHFHNTFPLLSPAALRVVKEMRIPVVLTLHNFRPICAAGTFLRDGRICEECLTRRLPLPAVRHGCYRDSRVASVPLAAMIAIHRELGTWTDHVDRIVLPSMFTLGRYRAAGWPSEKLVVKYNTTRIRADVRVGAGAGFVAVSRLTAEKGIDVLIDAWKLAFPDGSQTLSIIGAGDDAQALRAQGEGVKGLEFLGPLPMEEVVRRLAQARALVMPSRWYEVFPRTVVEAYSVAVPVVASRIGALSEVVRHGQTGLLFEPESVDELARNLRLLAANSELAETLGRRAREDYEESFGARPTTIALIGIYRELLNTLTPGPGR